MANRPDKVASTPYARCAVVLAVVMVGILARGRADAQDFQSVAPGKGTPASECVNPGPNAVLNSTPLGDDYIFGGSILSGADGICDTPLTGDDVRPANGVQFHGGLPHAVAIEAGTPGGLDGICNDLDFGDALGDDVVLVGRNKSRPGMLEIAPGFNGAINSVAAGDDVATAVICPGPNGIVQSTPPGGDDLQVSSGPLCTLCAQSAGCLTPGPNGVLETGVQADDVVVPFISTGPNGIAESIASGDDGQVIAVLRGFPGTVCVDSGADGIVQTSLCGNGITDDEENGLPGTIAFPECDDGNGAGGDGCSAICVREAGWTCTGEPSVCTPICGDGLVVGNELCDDGNTRNDDDCLSCTPAVCGDGFVHDRGTAPFEECEPPNTATCDGSCQLRCGNGIVEAGEECDDGNNRNDDACVAGCRNARCGDGFKERSVEECDDGCLAGVPHVCEAGIDDTDNGCSSTCTRTRPTSCGNGTVESPEQCDDGNNSDNDDCTNSCRFAVCGDGIVHDKQSGSEQCDDGNTASGDGCSATCMRECGNGVLDFYCSEPEASVGRPCASDPDCDSAPSAGDGRCITGEECDPGAAALCIDDHMSPVCSNFCVIKTCGNSLVECDEECDLGADNGVAGSGCTTGCRRYLAEKPGADECPAAFTVDLPPQPLPRERQICQDGAACDFDHSVNGQCVFRIGVCLNLSQPGCTPGGLRTFDLLGVKIRGTCTEGRTGARCVVGQDCDTSVGAGDGTCLRDRAVIATTTLTDAVAALAAPGTSSVPGRCRAGLKGKVCSVNNECDRAFGLGDGRCDIGTGVEFDPPLDPADQVGICTPGQDIVVDAGSRLKLQSFVRRTSRRSDHDRLVLICQP